MRKGRVLRTARRPHSQVSVAGQFACTLLCSICVVALGHRLDPPRYAAEEPLAIARPRRLAEDLGVSGLQLAHRYPFQTRDVLIHVHADSPRLILF